MDKFFSESVSNLYRLLTWYPAVTAGISIFLGLIWCFFGYRVFRPLLVATVALVGALVGFSFAASVTVKPLAWIVASLMGALVGGVVGFVFVYVSVFLLGMNFAAAGAWVLFTVIGKMPHNQAVLPSLVVGAAGGLLALLLMRPLLVVYTALTGALWVVATVVDLIVAVPALKDPTQFNRVYSQNLQPFLFRYWHIIASCVIVLFAAGVIYQFSSGQSPAEETSESDSSPARKAKAA